MRPPATLEEVLRWYDSGKITHVEFFPLFLFLVEGENVGELMSRLPDNLRASVVRDAKSLCEARQSGEELLDFTFGAAEVAAEEHEAAMFEWLRENVQEET